MLDQGVAARQVSSSAPGDVSTPGPSHSSIPTLANAPTTSSASGLKPLPSSCQLTTSEALLCSIPGSSIELMLLRDSASSDVTRPGSGRGSRAPPPPPGSAEASGPGIVSGSTRRPTLPAAPEEPKKAPSELVLTAMGLPPVIPDTSTASSLQGKDSVKHKNNFLLNCFLIVKGK